jgi:hypothetical protein
VLHPYQIGLPEVWTLVLQIVPRKAAGTGSGIVDGVGNAFSAFAPVIMGYFIENDNDHKKDKGKYN